MHRINCPGCELTPRLPNPGRAGVGTGGPAREPGPVHSAAFSEGAWLSVPTSQNNFPSPRPSQCLTALFPNPGLLEPRDLKPTTRLHPQISRLGREPSATSCPCRPLDYFISTRDGRYNSRLRNELGTAGPVGGRWVFCKDTDPSPTSSSPSLTTRKRLLCLWPVFLAPVFPKFSLARWRSGYF